MRRFRMRSPLRNGRLDARPRGPAAPRVLVLTAEEGEGHTSVAQALAAELHAAGAGEVVVHDAFRDAFGRFVPLVSRDVYRVQLRRLPWSYGLEYRLFTGFAPARAVARRGLALFAGRPLSRLIRRHSPDIIVSTHPAVTSVLGHLRARGRLHARVLATITDFGVHPFWAHPGVDLHLVMHPASLDPVERTAGRGSAAVVRPIVAPTFRRPCPRAEARAAAGLPPAGPVVLISGGGWGVGDLEGAVRAVLTLPEVTVVCVSGRNEELRRGLEAAFGAEPRVRVLGFTDRMSQLLAAADALVDATIGVTCLEALTRGCPIVAYGCPPGHSTDNATALARLGLGESAATPEELVAALARAVELRPAERPSLAGAPAAGPLVLSAPARILPWPAWRRSLAPAAAAAAATLALGGWTFASAAPYPIVAHALGLNGLRAVQTPHHEVGLVVSVPAPLVDRLARALERTHDRASFALQKLPDPRLPILLRGLGDEILPALGGDASTHWLRARGELRRAAQELGLNSRFYYLAPASGLTLAEYVFARSAGGLPVVGAMRVEADGRAAASELRPGAVIVVTLDPAASAPAALGQLVALLHARRLRSVTVSELVTSARRTAPTADERASAATPPATPTIASGSTQRVPEVRRQDSPATAGASATGIIVFSTNTIGAT